jgi:hypothetical protein
VCLRVRNNHVVRKIRGAAPSLLFRPRLSRYACHRHRRYTNSLSMPPLVWDVSLPIAWPFSGSVTVVQSSAVITCRECASKRAQWPMLRRANTGLHRQCHSHHPLSQRLQNPSHRCPYSLSERESRSRLGQFSKSLVVV